MSRAGRLASTLMALAVLAACSGRQKAVIPGEGISVEQQQTTLRKKVAVLLEKRNYRRAIELIGGRNRPGAPAAGMEREYLLAINGAIASGEQSLSHGDYAGAGQCFRLGLDFYPLQPALRGRVKRDPVQLRKQLDICANRLLEQGLLEYRSGNLQNAIVKWREIIAFDAGHKEANKAIETATVQLRALQYLEKPRQ